jgi:uncharacterized membrane protein SpoIIM required for sporulation/ABC-type transport system involved in multi-copper enzyme maturation permease subunit
MFASLSPALTITRREIRDQLRDWRIVAPIILLTIFFPGLMNFTAAQAVDFVGQYGADVVAERLIPFLLMIVGFFPISISLVIALESFVGEKERRSIEPLLSSPLYDWQLYLGKLLASLAPPLLASYLGISVYLYGVNRQVGYSPEPELLMQIIALTTVQAVVMVSGAVVISTQTTSARAANLLASFIIIPMALLIQGESVIMFWGQYGVLWGVIFAELLIAILLVRMGIAHFNREELLGRELDTLNFRWMWQVFSEKFKHSGKDRIPGLLAFYRHLFKLISKPGLATLLVLIGGMLAGAILSTRYHLPVEFLRLENLEHGVFFEELEILPFFSAGGIFLVWFHNLRAILLATLAGVFSFGVFGLMILMLPLTIIGYLMALLSGSSISPGLFFLAFILPHGILEIPAILVAGAAILRLGATLAAPADGETIGAAFLGALADWLKIFVFVVAPLLLGAAVLEIYVTPQVAVWLMSR